MPTHKAPLKPDGEIRKIGVKSRSNPEAPPYEVLVYPDGMITCPCKGYMFKKACYHTKRVKKFLEETDDKSEQKTPIETAPVPSPVVDVEELDRLLGS